MAVSVEIWHNPRCSKSRQALALLKDQGVTPNIRLYLKDSPSEKELRTVLDQLGMTARDILRTGEPECLEAGVDKISDEETLITAMVQFPKLIERPIIRAGDKAILGRPPENVLDII
ncbi:MAG: arsenate reductase (glutaredoxin) [Silicimonas sp.]|nr:arsenate reductase (glutaredoxin) [Silicimonas sp.]